MKERVDKILGEINSVTVWLAGIICTTALISSQGKPTLKILDAEFDRPRAGLLLFAVVSLVCIHLLRLLSLLLDSIATSTTIEPEVLVALHTNLSPFTPLSLSPGGKRYILDSVGIAALISVWWIGAISGMRLLTAAPYAYGVPAFVLFCVYMFMAMLIAGAYGRLMKICLPMTVVIARIGVVSLLVAFGLWFGSRYLT